MDTLCKTKLNEFLEDLTHEKKCISNLQEI